SQFEIRNSRLVPEVFLSSADVIPGILGADQDAMPFTIFERMRRVVADTVLVAQLGGDLVQNLLDFAAAILGPIAGQEPGLTAAGIGKGVQDVHVHRDAIGSAVRSPLWL